MTTSQHARIVVADIGHPTEQDFIDQLHEHGFSIGFVSYEDLMGPKDQAASSDVVVLDLRRFYSDTWTRCAQIRAHYVGAILAVLSGANPSQLRELDNYVDDWIAAPLRGWELTARVATLASRPEKETQRRRPLTELPGTRVRLELDRRGRVVRWDGRALHLTRIEFSLMSVLIAGRQHPVTRGELQERVWGSDLGATPHTVEVHVGNLRRKLRDFTGQSIIETVYGEGYRIVVDHQTQSATG